jgi:DNA-directed RNA polymerase beta subunit
LEPNTPASFNVLLANLRGLGIDVELMKETEDGQIITSDEVLTD